MSYAGQEVLVPIIAISNQKGGVGKTATVANLGAALVQAGKRVLLVDLDAQANLSLSCGVAPGQVSAYEVLMEAGVGLAEATVATRWPGLDVLPASDALAAAQVQLATAPQRNERLRGKLADATSRVPTEEQGSAPPTGFQPVPPAYDYVLIDTPPSLGFLTLNALTAADLVLIPVQASFLALHGIRQLMQTVEVVQARSNPALRVGGVLVTMYDSRTLHAQQVVERLRQHFGALLFEATIRRSVAFDYATVAGTPLVLQQPGHACAAAYSELAREVMTRA